ncbi:hypothetical protein HanPSC8_Chr09g0371021 [Helianthus annuus]|nr:hypothetical protein HanIR_Chr09g0415351 [Helianthus annuus]KAJ0542181.1 hypothetical protein HanHA89_Chr09g0336981 [Helianthus annuus]KAJ0892864.1 hypothetical protein HanPSC8_Chr09g0371021 [Helianthus annuus]
MKVGGLKVIKLKNFLIKHKIKIQTHTSVCVWIDTSTGRPGENPHNPSSHLISQIEDQNPF